LPEFRKFKDFISPGIFGPQTKRVVGPNLAGLTYRRGHIGGEQFFLGDYFQLSGGTLGNFGDFPHFSWVKLKGLNTGVLKGGLYCPFGFPYIITQGTLCGVLGGPFN